ncbi:MAG: hypothetical protein U1E42_05770 [Rhodospirillales bacterium]
MWIFLNNAFLSIVAHRDDPSLLLVRARFKGDIEAVFPAAAVAETLAADYRFRAPLSRDEVAQAIALALRTMTADNFKSSVGEHWRHDLYLDVWSTLATAQRHRAARAARQGQRRSPV